MATNFQDLAAKVKNLVTLAPVFCAISRPAILKSYPNMMAAIIFFSTEEVKVCLNEEKMKFSRYCVVKVVIMKKKEEQKWWFLILSKNQLT